MRTLARHLIPQPDLDNVAEFVCALLSGPLGAEEVLFAGRPDGDEVELIGQYPLHRVDPLKDSASFSSQEVVDLIVSAAAQHGPVLRTDASTAVPMGGHFRPIAAWPLGCPADADAYLVIRLVAPLPPSVVADRLQALAEVLALYVLNPNAPFAQLPGRHRSHLAPRALVPGGPDRPLGRTVTLTPRQCRILHLMASGLTDPQIAMRMGFSTSTIRLETIKIFRALDVHDRKSAVEAAQTMQMLSPQAVDAGGEPTCRMAVRVMHANDSSTD